MLVNLTEVIANLTLVSSASTIPVQLFDNSSPFALQKVNHDFSLMSLASIVVVQLFGNNSPLALQKNNCFTRNPYYVYNFLSYHIYKF